MPFICKSKINMGEKHKIYEYTRQVSPLYLTSFTIIQNLLNPNTSSVKSDNVKIKIDQENSE